MFALTALAFALPGAAVQADAAPEAARDVYLVIGAAPERDPRLSALARTWASARAHQPRDLRQEQQAEPSARVTRLQLELLNETEQALLEARELSASLREAAALRALETAESKLLASLDVPGAHAYLAEVYVQLGLCAAQLGAEGLAETALTRAFSLDRTRRVEAAETPPATLAFAQRIARAHASRPSSETPLTIAPPSALLWLDGVAQAAGVSALRAPAGVHLLVARAPGHAPYAALLNLQPGRRQALAIVLSPLPAQQAERALRAAGGSVKEARAPAIALARLNRADVYLLETAPRTFPRALVHRCAATGCNLVEGIDASSAAHAHFRAAAEAQAWLDAAPASATKPDSIAVWRRWPLWVAAATLVVSGATAALLATRDQTTHHQRQLEIDPGAPAP
jgi:hypothetical protein